MTEQDYIYVHDLSNVKIARNCVYDLNPGYSVMTDKERRSVMRILKRWEHKLGEKIAIQESP